jgi:hypothetical protein
MSADRITNMLGFDLRQGQVIIQVTCPGFFTFTLRHDGQEHAPVDHRAALALPWTLLKNGA